MCIEVQRIQFIAVCAEFKLLKLNPVMQSINKVDFLNERTGSLSRFLLQLVQNTVHRCNRFRFGVTIRRNTS